ncbi:prepilin-type N-terminal cleavage/methylation domain-containing protein [bacterium]|nr:prepilin-type N-terminal cleavage/methylation domain-containing protein [bacterium]
MNRNREKTVIAYKLSAIRKNRRLITNLNLAPLATHCFPLSTLLSPLASRLSPLTSRLLPLASRAFSRPGFTLIEVMVSTLITATMIIALLSYVKAGSDLWKKGEQTVNLSARSRVIFDLVSRDLAYATRVASPAINDYSASWASLTYDIPIGTGTFYGTGTFQLDFASKARTLTRKWKDYSFGTANIVASTTNEAAATSKICRFRHEYLVARDVEAFSVSHPTAFSVIIGVRLSSITKDDENNPEQVYEATNTFIVPCGK